MKMNQRIHWTIRGVFSAARSCSNAAPRPPKPGGKASPAQRVGAALIAGLLLLTVSAGAATVTYDFNNGTLQGWHNRVWNPALNGGAGAWADLAPNVTDPAPIVLQPPSTDDQVFGNSGTQIDPIGGQNDNHLNTLWLRSPQFVLDASGPLTVQMARGKAHGTAPANDASVSYIANGTTGWKGVMLRRVSDGVFVVAKPRINEGDAMVTVTFSAAELAPYVGVNCTLDLINSEHGGWGWLSMDNVSIPGAVVQPAKLTTTAPSMVTGSSSTVVLSIPNGCNATSAVNVYVTNSNPSVVTINGSSAAVTTVTFPAGGAISQNLTVAGVGLGFARLTSGCAVLISDTALLTVLSPSGLIGHWLDGSQDLLDKSGYTPAGTHDGRMSDGLTASFSLDVPPGASGSSLDLSATGGAVLINNSAVADAGYRPTFDDGIANQVSVVFWGKGYPGDWNPFISKYGESSTGWQIRKRANQPVATFTVRNTGGEDDPFNGWTTVNDGAWHHFAAIWDGVAGVRKLYVDGKLNSTVPHDAGPMGLAVASYLTLGGRCNPGATSPGNTLYGQLYDVQVYGVALPGSAVQSLYNQNTTAVMAYTEKTVLGVSQSGQVSISIPANANASTAVTVYVTNASPAVVSLAGAVANVVALSFPAGAATSQMVTLTGLSEGQAQLNCAASGLTGASAVVQVYGHHVIGHWFNGAENYTDTSGFAVAGTHDGSEVGSLGTLTFVSDTPPSKPGKAAQFGGSVGLQINNTSELDAGYATTFDDVIASQFSVAFWAKGIPGTWNAFLSKRGEDNIGWQVRRGGGITEAFTLRGTGSGNDDGVGSVAINDGQWHHYASVFDGVTGTRKCYVDGNLDPSVNLTNDFAPYMLAPNHHLVLGAREVSAVAPVPGIESPLSGLLYEVKMYNYPLTTAEVKALAFIAALKVLPAQQSLHAPSNMVVSIVLPDGANQSQAITVNVTNNTPSFASLSGAVGNVVTLNYPVGSSLTQQVTVVGIADGKAQLTAGGGGFVAGVGTFNVWADPGSKLIGHWLSGTASLADTSGFRPAGTHDGVAVGANAGSYSFSSDVPSAAPPGSVALDLTVGNVGVMITNTSSAELNYVETFDNQIANKFSITVWAKGLPGQWDPFISKRGEDNLGYQIRRFSNDDPARPTFTIRGSAGDDDPWPGGTVDAATWHHYAATWDGTTGIRKLYVDGNSVISLSGDFGPLAMDAADHLMLGAREQGGFGHWFPGLLFDARIYSYALSAQEVGVIFNPPTSFSLAVSYETIPLGETVQLVVTLPSGSTATSPVTVYLTNNSPSVVTIQGPSVLTFPIGSLVQVVNLLTIGPGRINITAGAAGVGAATMTTVNTVVLPKLIGHWLDGTADLTNRAGFSPDGLHDGVIVGANPDALGFSTDVPPGYSGKSLDLTTNANNGTTVGVVIGNSAATDLNYSNTFDNGISSTFSVAFWAKGVPGTWNGFVSKRGEDGIGWQLRRSGGDTEAFTVRGTGSGNYDGVGSIPIIDGQWHHFAGVWDGITGIRKCYVDGVLDPSVNLVGDYAPMSPAPSHHVGIGTREQSNVGNYEGWFAGKVFDVRIYNYPITASDVAALVTVPKPVLTIQYRTGNQVRLAWPTTFTGYSIVKSSSLSGGWTAAGLTVTVEGSENAAYAPTAGVPQYFRLKK
jgi:hypothetical protein